MVTRTRRNGALYSFYLIHEETRSGWKHYIKAVKTPDDEKQPEIIKNIPVKTLDGYSIKINKKSISAADGARGAFSFIRNCIRNDFMMTYVYKIIETFFD